MQTCKLSLGLTLSLLTLSSGAYANDSAAEMSIGGLQFTRSDAIAMQSETLTIALDAIDVRYAFRNTSGKPVTLTVGFPLPDIDLAEGENVSVPTSDPENFVGFTTRIDGRAVALTIDQRALMGATDVTGQLQGLKIPLLPLGARELRPADLPAPTRDRLVNDGLLMPAGSDERGRTRYAPAWRVRTAAVREQTFPAEATVTVEHHYRPSVGSNPDTILRKGMRQNKALSSEVARYRREYCVTDSFLAELDKRAGTATANAARLDERRITYILKTGANWAGPIKSFNLTIKPGAPDRLVSFCADRLKLTKTTSENYTANDFKPDADLKILIVGTF